MSDFFEHRGSKDFGFTNSDEQIAEAHAWRTAALADGWEGRATYEGHEPLESACSLSKDGFKVHILTREKKPGGKWKYEAEICIWGPDGLSIRPPRVYNMNALRAGMRRCSACGAEDVDTQRYSFAGRCCAACRPAMAKKYEYPGWTR